MGYNPTLEVDPMRGAGEAKVQTAPPFSNRQRRNHACEGQDNESLTIWEIYGRLAFWVAEQGNK